MFVFILNNFDILYYQKVCNRQIIRKSDNYNIFGRFLETYKRNYTVFRE